MLSIDFKSFPQLTTQRLLLRKIEMEDVNAVFSLRTNPEVMKYIDKAAPQNIDEAKKLVLKIINDFKNNEGITWGIILKESEALIGTIGFWRIMKEHYRAEIGYMLLPQFKNKGIMSEALQVVLQFGFAEMKLHSIEANVNPNNIASIKLLEKNNFIREAYFKENYFFNGNFLDTVIYSLLNPF